MCKQANIRRHSNTNHSEISSQFPPDQDKLTELRNVFGQEKAKIRMISLGQSQKQATEAYFRVSNLIAQRMTPIYSWYTHK